MNKATARALAPRLVATVGLVTLALGCAEPSAAVPGYGTALKAAKHIAQKHKNRGNPVRLATISQDGIPTAEDFSPGKTNSVLALATQGTGLRTPVFNHRVREGDPGTDWRPRDIASLTSQRSYRHYFSGPGIDPADLWIDTFDAESTGQVAQRRVTSARKNTAPLEPYFAAEVGTLENRGTTTDGIYLSAVWDRTDVVNSGIRKFTPRRNGAGEIAMTPVFPQGSEPQTVIDSILEAVRTKQGYRTLDAQRGLVEIDNLTVGIARDGGGVPIGLQKVKKVRAVVFRHANGSSELRDFWPVYDRDDVPLAAPESQLRLVEPFATAGLQRHSTRASLQTDDEDDALIRFVDGAPPTSITEPSRTVASPKPVFSLPAHLDSPAPAFCGNNSTTAVQFINNRSVLPPATRYLPTHVQRRGYLQSTASNGVRTYAMYEVTAGRQEARYGTGSCLPIGRSAAFKAARMTYDGPSTRRPFTAEDGTQLELRFKYVEEAWLVVTVDTKTDLIRGVAVVDPAKYAGKGENWRPTL